MMSNQSHLPPRRSFLIGIDPGHTGAIAVFNFEHPKLVDVYDMPLRNKSTNKFEVDGDEVGAILRKYDTDRFLAAVIEHPTAMPNDGPVQAFTFGYGCGIVNGVCNGLSIPVFNVGPSVWKSYLGLSQNKRDSIILAQNIFPESRELFKRQKDDGRAEAALLAYFGAKYGTRSKL